MGRYLRVATPVAWLVPPQMGQAACFPSFSRLVHSYRQTHFHYNKNRPVDHKCLIGGNSKFRGFSNMVEAAGLTPTNHWPQCQRLVCLCLRLGISIISKKAPVLTGAFNMVEIDQFKGEEVELNLHSLTELRVLNVYIQPGYCPA